MSRALILGYDGSECADAALDAAVDLALGTGDRLVVAFGYKPGDPGEEHAAHREVVKQYGERVTAAAIEKAGAAGLQAELALVPERPIDALLSLAEQHDARAIIVGTYGEGPIRAAILGSVPHKLLQVATRPVLVVPIPE